MNLIRGSLIISKLENVEEVCPKKFEHLEFEICAFLNTYICAIRNFETLKILQFAILKLFYFHLRESPHL